MLRTRVGYAGGTTLDPTYRRIGDHTEVFQVDYDPQQIGFARLLDFFWEAHNPCSSAWSTQYQAILFYADEEEKRIAEESAAVVARKRGRPVLTQLKQADRFYYAEDYHQKYALRGHRGLFQNIRSMFETERAFAESTVATKVNSFLDGYLTFAQVETELAKVGLRAIGNTRGIERIELVPAEVDDGGEPTSRTTSQQATSRPTTSRPSGGDAGKR